MGGKVLQLESERLREEGEARLSALINRLILNDRVSEIQRVVTDENRRKELYQEYGL